MQIVKRYLLLYKSFLRQYLKKLVQSRIDFALGILAFLVVQASGIIFLYLIFNQIPTLAGWRFEEIIFIYGFSQIPKGLDHLVADNLWLLSSSMIIKGDFDKYLIRPINPLFHLLADRFQPDAIGELIIGLILLLDSKKKLGLEFTFDKMIYFVILVVFCALIFTSIKLIFASLSFWIKDSLSILQLNYMLNEYCKYPINIYSKFIKFIISFIIPFAFAQFFPASYLLNKDTVKTGVITTMLISTICFFISIIIWTNGIKRYESTGN